MNYLKHLIECQCILPIYRNSTKPIFHKFPVFSLFEDYTANNDFSRPIEKYVKCNNCDCVHKVYDICKSELLKNSDSYVDLVTTLDDLKYSLPSDLIEVLSKHQMDIADYEMASHLLKYKINDKIILSKKTIKNDTICKFLIFEDGKFYIKQEKFQSLEI